MGLADWTRYRTDNPDVLVIGMQAFSAKVVEVMRISGWNPIGVASPEFELPADADQPRADFEGLPYIGTIGTLCEDNANLPARSCFLAVGDAAFRSKVYRTLRSRLRFVSIIHPSASVSPTSKIGDGVFVGAMAVLDPHTVIGPMCVVNNCCNVSHHSVLEACTKLGPGAIILGSCYLHAGSYVGANATLLPHVEIAEDVTVGAGAVLLRSVDDPSVLYVGVPAGFKKIKSK